MKIPLRIIVGCFSLVNVANFCHAGYPPIEDALWRRLAGGELAVDLFGQTEVEEVGKCIVPEVFKELVDRAKKATPKERMFSLMPLGTGEKFKPERYNLVNDFTFNIELALRRFYHPVSEEDVSSGSDNWHDNSDNDSITQRLDELKQFDDFDAEEYRRDEIRRCEKILKSEEFWEGVLGEEWFEAFAKSCNQKEGRPSARLHMSGRSFLLEGNESSEECEIGDEECEIGDEECEIGDEKCGISGLGKEEIQKAVDKLCYTLCLSQWHYEKIDEHTGKSVKVSKKGEKYDKKITDFELNLRLTVNMATEEIEKVEVFDKFTVNVTFSYFPDGKVVFEKK